MLSSRLTAQKCSLHRQFLRTYQTHPNTKGTQRPHKHELLRRCTQIVCLRDSTYMQKRPPEKVIFRGLSDAHLAYVERMVISTSTPGSRAVDVICLTTSLGL